jgi:hypothetical protein
MELQKKALSQVTSFLEEESFFSRLDPSTLATPTMILLNSRYEIISWSEAKVIMDSLFKSTESEEGCMYFGWHKEGNNIVSRAAFRSSAAVLAHFEHSSTLAQKLASGPAKRLSVEIHGPQEELGNLRESKALASLKPEYFEEHVFVNSQGNMRA